MAPPDNNIEEEEKTAVFYTFEDILACALGVLPKIRKSHDLCLDAWGPSVVLGTPVVKDAFIAVHKRGAKIRLITEITSANIDYCKQFMEFAEVRHLDKVRGNFSISDGKWYTASAVAEKDKPPPRLIYSNVQEIANQHQYFFETLWSRAIPAEDKVKEIQGGTEPEFVHVITDGTQAANLIIDFASSVRKEAQLILPQPKTMERAAKLGIWNHLIDAANNYGAEIRVISPLTEENSDLAKHIMDKAPNIKVLVGPVSTAGLFIQDERRYFRAEDKNPDAAQASDAISRVIYSNSKNGVKSFKSIFDTLWKQSELYEQLRIANEKLVSQDRLQKEFINIAAHELRTPIQPILGVSELLELHFKAGEAGKISKDEIEIIIRNAKRLERLSYDILEIARIESGNLHLNVQEFDLNEIISPLVQDAKSQIKANGKSIDITHSPAYSDMVLRGDKHRLTEVLGNLLNNAVKFTETGTIFVEATKDDSQVTVTVKDTGKGIDSEVLPRLFTKFATKSEKGTGLGLYISKSIVEAHGGQIWAENNSDGKGATFTFTIPLDK